MCKTSLKVLWQDYQIIREASHKDDLVDEDHDGIADVKEVCVCVYVCVYDS
jgi:hypothetical protein